LATNFFENSITQITATIIFKSKRRLIFLFFLVVGFTGYAQISYEKGYFIDNAGKKTDCLIRNADWMINPKDFQYRLSENGETLTRTLISTKEFGIYNQSKYISALVNLDSSSDDVDQLGITRTPNFSEQKLFLQVLVEGKANLYMYEDNYGRKYFYKTDTSEIQPLIFKRYITSNNKIGENNRYKQQLWSDLSFQGLTQKKLSNLKYNKKELTNFFVNFNGNNGGEVVDFEKKDKRDLFNLTLRPGMRSSSLSFNSAFSSLSSVDYDNELSFRFGAEVEAIMPFNKNKWSLFIEPSYQYYKTEKEVRSGVSVAIDYQAIEMAMGARHYMYLNDTSKIFINAGFVLAFSDNSKINYGNGSYLDLERSSNAAFGIGYNYNDTYSLEFNYHLNRGMLNFQQSEAIYQSFSIILGYTLF